MMSKMSEVNLAADFVANEESLAADFVASEHAGQTAKQHTGYVYFVGAGPGDPDLLTIKGRQAIEKADVIIYDRLISPDILNFAKPECRLVFVGKSPGRHYRIQEEINDLLIKSAAEGTIAVRLKGGDPFVFGRGGEEALALEKHGIAFEVIPGVTSAIAVPAYAGIPVTHRGLSSSFTVITGHEDPQKDESSIDWEHLSKTGGTLVFLMGMSNLSTITGKLMEKGMDAATPTAVIENGAMPEQRTICGELGSISSLALQNDFKNPAIIVIGEVVALRDELQWFEKKPLFGQNIMVTRARHQASRLTTALAELGATVHELPVIAIEAPTNPEQLSRAVKELASYTWLIFTSVNGVEAFFAEVYTQGLDTRWLAGTEIVAIGPSTQKALEDKGLRNIIVPKEYYAEGIMEELGGRITAGAGDKTFGAGDKTASAGDKTTGAGDKVLLVRAEKARNTLPRMLTELGAEVKEVAAYKTVSAEVDTKALMASLRAKEFDAITFTSSSTVHQLMKMIGEDVTLLSDVRLYSIGPITSDTLRSYGLKPTAQASDFCIDGLVRAIIESSFENHR